MNLHEYQSKRLFARQGIAVPQGFTADSPAAARRIAEDFGQPVAVKAQVLIGGRGKAGGIRVAATPAAAEAAAADILGMDIRGHTVHRLLIEAASEIQSEIYLAALVDRESQRIMLMASGEGGMEIEEVAARSPEKIRRAYADPFMGVRDHQGIRLAKEVGLPPRLWSAFAVCTRRLHATLTAYDADLAEINPLIVDASGALLALDGKMSVDDSALHRQPELVEDVGAEEGNPFEREAQAAGLNFVYLGGDVACLGNGAGLAMATMDAIKHFGGNPANFLDIGGDASVDQVTKAIDIMTRDPAVRSLLVNVSGGITRCDEVAAGLAAAMDGSTSQVPFVVRLVGTNEEEAKAILAPYRIEYAETFSSAARRSVELARENGA